jgi:putative pre-16S rRNA nuclease
MCAESSLFGGDMPVVLGLDYGERRIGLAVSDPTMLIAQPLSLIRRTTDERDLKVLRQVLDEREVDKIVVGLPINMDGSEGPMALAARKFAALIEQFGLPVEMWDERLSSRAAEAMLLEADLTRKKRKGVRDKVAAAWFLQGYLDAMRNREANS